MTNQNSMIVALGVVALGVTAAVCVANSSSLTSSPVADVAPRGIVLADKTTDQVKPPTLKDVKQAETKLRNNQRNLKFEDPVGLEPMDDPRTKGLDRGKLPQRSYPINAKILPNVEGTRS